MIASSHTSLAGHPAWPAFCHGARSPIAVALGRAQLADRRLRRGDVRRLDEDLAAIGRALRALEALLDAPDHDRPV
jgi:hypothetical protein